MNACWVVSCCLAALAGADAPAVGPRLTVRIAAPASVVSEFTVRLNARLTARGVGLEVTPVPEVDFERLVATPPDTADGAPLARVWLDGRDPSRVLLFVIPRQGQRVLVRKVELTEGFDQVALAQTTYIIDRAVASLLVSEPIGVPQSEARAAVEAVLPVAPPPAEPSAGARLSLGAFGGVGTWSPDAIAVGRVGIEGSLERAGGGRRLGVAASVVVDPLFHVREPRGELLARSLTLHLYATVTWRAGRAGAGGLAVGPALIITHVDPKLSLPSPSDMAVETAGTDLDPAVGATARWDLPLGPRASVFLAAMVDVVPRRTPYVATIQGQEQVLFSPWMVRPGLVLGVTAALGPR